MIRQSTKFLQIITRGLRAQRQSTVTVCFIVLVGTFSHAENWPGWRGPRGDGSSFDKQVPTTWNVDTGKNIVWRKPIPGKGHSSPIVWADRVFLTACLDETEQRLLICLNKHTGEFIWQQPVLKSKLETHHTLNSRASGTPATDGKYIYVAFMETDGRMILAPNVGSQRNITAGSIVVAAYDFHGNQKWIARPGEFISAHGFCSCPILYKDFVILNGDHDGNSYIVALDRETGKVHWRKPRENGIRSYVTPIIREIDNRTQMVFSGSKHIVSMNPDNGNVHWKINGPTEQFVASMVFDGQQFYMNCGYPDHYVVAVNPNGKGDVTDSAISWESRKARSYVPSPVVFNGYLLVADDRGTANCFDTETGDRFWQTRLGSGFNASIIHANGLAYFFATDGEAIVVRPGKTLDVVAKNSLREFVSSSAAVSDGRLFVRGEKSLFCIGKVRAD